MTTKPSNPGALSTLRTQAAKSGWTAREPLVRKLPPVNGYRSPAIEKLTLTAVESPKPRAKRKPSLTIKRAERVAEVTADAVAAYNRILAKPHGVLPPVTGVNMEARRKQVNGCIEVAMEICQQHYGDTTITPKFWEDYFYEVSNDDFRSGRKASSNMAHANWKPDFEYLVRPATMVKVFEGAV